MRYEIEGESIDTDDCIKTSCSQHLLGYGILDKKDRKFRTKYHHRQVFIEQTGIIPTSKEEIRHLCGNASCVNILHLKLGTRQSNAKDTIVHGSQRGSKNPRAILNEETVPLIRKMLRTNTHQAVADAFGISKSLVVDIQKKRRWGHIP